MGKKAITGALEQNVSVLPLGPRSTHVQVIKAQRNLAVTALEHPRFGCVEEREAELEEVLRALGICNRNGIIEMRAARVGPRGSTRKRALSEDEG